MDLMIGLLKDEVRNDMKCVYERMVLGDYVKEDVERERSEDWENKGKSKRNSVEEQFNKMVGKWVVDVGENEVGVGIKIGGKEEGEDILKKIEGEIDEEIRDMEGNYQF